MRNKVSLLVMTLAVLSAVIPEANAQRRKDRTRKSKGASWTAAQAINGASSGQGTNPGSNSTAVVPGLDTVNPSNNSSTTDVSSFCGAGLEVRNGKCEPCEDGKYKTGDMTGSCVPCSEYHTTSGGMFATKCDKVTGIPTECVAGYKVEGGECVFNTALVDSTDIDEVRDYRLKIVELISDMKTKCIPVLDDMDSKATENWGMITSVVGAIGSGASAVGGIAGATGSLGASSNQNYKDKIAAGVGAVGSVGSTIADGIGIKHATDLEKSMPECSKFITVLEKLKSSIDLKFESNTTIIDSRVPEYKWLVDVIDNCGCNDSEKCVFDTKKASDIKANHIVGVIGSGVGIVGNAVSLLSNDRKVEAWSGSIATAGEGTSFVTNTIAKGNEFNTSNCRKALTETTTYYNISVTNNPTIVDTPVGYKPTVTPSTEGSTDNPSTEGGTDNSSAGGQ